MTGSVTRLHFARPPGTGRRYLRIATSRKPARLPAGSSIPELEAVQAPQPIESSHLGEFLRVCGLDETAQVPLTYPHVLAARLQLALLSSPAFPLRLLGLVHLRNEIVQYRPIGAEDKIGLRITVGGHRDTDKGQEFDIVTRATRGDELVWLETSTALARGPRTAKTTSSGETPPPDQPSFTDRVSWQVPADIGRRYAGVSADYNPIHLSPMTAKWFGFRRPIAHGMWSVARCFGELGLSYPRRRCEARVAFGKPLYMPGWVVLDSRSDGERTDYRLCDPEGGRVFLSGAIDYF